MRAALDAVREMLQSMGVAGTSAQAA
jgi:hypothetical protein